MYINCSIFFTDCCCCSFCILLLFICNHTSTITDEQQQHSTVTITTTTKRSVYINCLELIPPTLECMTYLSSSSRANEQMAHVKLTWCSTALEHQMPLVGGMSDCQLASQSSRLHLLKMSSWPYAWLYMSSLPDIVLLLTTRCLYLGVHLIKIYLNVICLLNWALENWTWNLSRLIFLFFLCYCCYCVIMLLLLFICHCASTITDEQQQNYIVTRTRTTATKRSVYMNCSISLF